MIKSAIENDGLNMTEGVCCRERKYSAREATESVTSPFIDFTVARPYKQNAQ